ncbi:MAG: hypothetical protein IJ740_09675 [Ruminococcus sp.]|nr:hypothetical protein [Ruminococcus sp.]
MLSNRGFLTTAAVASAAVMLFGMCAFAADADTITDNEQYITAVNTAENNFDSLTALGNVAENNNVYIENIGTLMGEVAAQNMNVAKAQAERIEKQEKEKEEAAKKKALEEQKKKEEEEAAQAAAEAAMAYDPDNCLSTSSGVYYGPSGKETYYNLDMSTVVSIMREMGYSEDAYPYYIRDDGCKMLGNYVIVACNFDLRPRGTLVQTSLGTGIVCDTSPVFVGDAATQVDIAVAW